MDSVCVYEQKTVIHELTQAIQMAKQLRLHLNSAEAREFLIQKILTSYANAFSVLKSSNSTCLPESLISIGSPQSGVFELDPSGQPFINQQYHNVVSKKRKGSTIWEDQAENTNKRNCPCDHGAQSAAQLLPPLLEMQEFKPTHYNQLSTQNSCEMLSSLGASLSVNTLAATIPSSDSCKASPFGFMEDYQQLHFLDHFDDELLQIYSPPIISPETSESNYFTEWSSSPTLDFSADPTDEEFRFNNSFY